MITENFYHISPEHISVLNVPTTMVRTISKYLLRWRYGILNKVQFLSNTHIRKRSNFSSLADPLETLSSIRIPPHMYVYIN